MNILAVFFHFPPISGGGVIVAVDIVNSFAQMGHNVTVLTPDLVWNGPEYKPEIDSKINVIHVKVPSNNNLKVAARRCKKPLIEKGKELADKIKFDFVFSIFHPFHFAPNAAISISEAFKIPAIIKIDDPVYEKSSGLKSIQRKVEKIISSRMLRKAAKILVANDETKKIVNDFYKVPIEKIKIIPNGIDTNLFYSNDSKKSKIVFFSGVMYYHRGLDVLLKSVPIVVKKIPKVKFLLIGEGSELDQLKKIVIDSKIEKNVEFKKWVERKEIISFLADASIGMGPLRSTTVTRGALPIKVLEYMAASLPIISQNNTLPRNVLIDGKNGFFVSNEEDLATKIIHLLENEEKREKMGLKSREMVSNFDWSIIGKKIIDEYENLRN